MFKFCSLASGSSGNCQYIESKDTKLLVDAGLSGKKIQEALKSIEVDPKELDGILVTHEHKDHTKGVGILSRRFDLPIYANKGTWDGMEDDLGKIKPEHIKIFDTNKQFNIKDIEVNPFDIYHDANEPVGYNFCYNSKKISILTDTGKIDEDIKKLLKGSDIMMIESNHDVEMLKVGSYPWFLKKRVLGDYGHISNETAGELIADLYEGKKQTILLSHLSRENNFPELAYQTVANIVTERGINIEKDISIQMTYRDMTTKVYKL